MWGEYFDSGFLGINGKNLEKIARDFLKKEYGLSLDIPVKVNGRIKNVNGRYMVNKKIEISKTYIQFQDWKIIKETLIHECIHYALHTLGKPFGDGDEYFENELIKHGSHSTNTIKYKGKVFVYTCENCGTTWEKKRKLSKNKTWCCSGCHNSIKYLGEKIIK